MRIEIRTADYVVWSLPLSSRLHQKSLGIIKRAGFGFTDRGIVRWGSAASLKEALRIVKNKEPIGRAYARHR
jgi:hypothetical protein